jgi:AcrR family transcriptional regulator
MTVYYQFRSKLGLLEALFDDLAQRGRIADLEMAFTMPDPLDGLDTLIGAFLGLWASDPLVMRRVRAASRLDPELEAALRSRDERRRHAIRTILGRLATSLGKPGPGEMHDAVDLLTALTGFDTYDQLAQSRPAEAVEALLRGAARRILGLV